jgi:intracellular septation protein
MSPLLKIALDLGPLVVFFGANAQFGIFTATAAFMVAVTISLAGGWIAERKLSPMPLITAVVVLVFGGLTIYLNDDTFIKLKPTIVNSVFAATLLGGLFMGRPLIKYLFESVFQLTDEGWRKLTLRWALFFIVLAVLNEYVWRNYSTDFWIAFKIWGVFPLTMIFAGAQVRFLQTHQLEDTTVTDSAP